ncbi:E3 ubiquitin-protein ligase DCST1-like isoform X1 [Ornithodoros turicata]|uniref:E3 ubiquitin-protein ligase DCST1-like isoform X1 n=1 Tax=Ornithodoros turicata TaxID=34597 RepID=UPI003138A510
MESRDTWFFLKFKATRTWSKRHVPIPILKFFFGEPGTYRCLRVFFGFVFGLFMGTFFYKEIVRKMFTTELTLRVMGTTVVLLTAVGYASSARARAISWLIVPFLCGRAGRTMLVTISVSLVLTGPLESMMLNSKAAVDSFMCLGALSFNHTKERLLLMYKPIKRIIWDFDKQAKVIHNATSQIDKEVQPIENEISAGDEVKKLEADADYVDKVSDSESRTQLVRDKYTNLSKELELGKEYEEDYAKKLELRCEGIFSQGVRGCRLAFKKAEERCFEALWILGYLLCWPMKLTIICHLVSTFLGKRTCDGLEPINAGFGQSIAAMKSVKREFDKNFRVNVQYKLVLPEDAINLISPDDLKKSVNKEFERRRKRVGIVATFLSRVFAVVIAGVILDAKGYVENYCDDITFDNVYVTEYFAKIDDRRQLQGLPTLLPLKRYEAIDVYDPTTLSLSRVEWNIVIKGCASEVVHIVFGSVMLGLDLLLYDVLDIIRRNAEVKFVQEGYHRIALQVFGTGAVSNLVRKIFKEFDVEEKLERISSNAHCLPKPVRTSRWLIAKLYFTYAAMVALVFAQMYSQRLRRVVCSYFYRKREKKRVLYLYNKILKRRVGYLKYTRHRIRKLVRERDFDLNVGWFEFLRKVTPRLYRVLQFLGITNQRTCLVCGDPENSDFYICPTTVCQCMYCGQCWDDIGRCYACEEEQEGESSLSDELFPLH